MSVVFDVNSPEPEFQPTLTVGTFSGRQIDLENIKYSDINIVDIAVGLAQQCRYAGQVWPFYSVAEHSVIISQLVQHSPGYDLALKALLHDAPEFLINDLVRPVKRRVKGYEAIEDQVMEAVSMRFDTWYSNDEWKAIKYYDDLITVVERRKLMPRLNPASYGRGVNELELPKVTFRCLPPAQAAMAFLRTYYHYTRQEPSREERGLIEIILRTSEPT